MIYALVIGFIAVVVLSLSLSATPRTVSHIDVFERIAFHADEKGIEFKLVKAIARAESNFNPLAKNPADPSFGLMQVTPMLAQDYGYVQDWRNPTAKEIKSLYDININLDIACRFLSRLSKYPFDRMIQSYNVGEYGYTIGHRNLDYLNKVRGYYDSY